jgi:prophage maintenance system killer protein
MVMALFLALNGLEMAASDSDVVTTIVALASGGLDEDALEDWIRRRTRKRPIQRAGEGA